MGDSSRFASPLHYYSGVPIRVAADLSRRRCPRNLHCRTGMKPADIHKRDGGTRHSPCTRAMCACQSMMGSKAGKKSAIASCQRRRTIASNIQATNRTIPAVRRRNPAVASKKETTSRHHSHCLFVALPAQSTKATLTKPNGSSVKSTSD